VFVFFMSGCLRCQDPGGVLPRLQHLDDIRAITLAARWLLARAPLSFVPSNVSASQPSLIYHDCTVLSTTPHYYSCYHLHPRRGLAVCGQHLMLPDVFNRVGPSNCNCCYYAPDVHPWGCALGGAVVCRVGSRRECVHVDDDVSVTHNCS
jgi:hypothetical protein